MSPLEAAVNDMVQTVHPIHRVMLDYVQSARTHRLCQLGWEESVNSLNADELLFFALKMSPHTRPAIFKRIRELNHPGVCSLMDKHGLDAERVL